MALHPTVFIVVGIIISIISFIIGDRFRLFFYVGVLFLAWGILRGIIQFTTAAPQKKYVCYQCKKPVSLGAPRCTHCGARLNHKYRSL